MYQVSKEVATMKTRDGITLVADVYRPKTEEKLPILLMRQPYGREIASTVVYAHPRWYASQGYMVVIQDVRGCGDSGGEFHLFESEIDDGEDTLNWVTTLEGNTGAVGMYGFSYQGMTQIYGAISQHQALKTICPAMIASDLYAHWAYENGAFCYELNLAWAIQLGALRARLKEDFSAYKLLYLASRHLPVWDIPVSVEKALRKYAPFYYIWLNTPSKDDYWRRLSPQSYLDRIDLPMLHIGGWFDGYLRGSWNFYEQMRAKSAFQQSLIVGPWCHIPWGNSKGNLSYSQKANNNINEAQINWFNHYLKGINQDKKHSKNIKLFLMGDNKYINRKTLKKKKYTKFYLNSTGLANIRDDDGKLLSKNKNNSEDIIVTDFWRPTPSLGGHNSINAGSFERGELDQRTDILTYTSDYLTEKLTLIGDISLQLKVACNYSSFDISAVLSQVYPDGRVYNFSQGYIRVKEHQENIPIIFNLQPSAIALKKNTALRLSISGSAFPAYDLNKGDSKDAQTITLSIFCTEESFLKI
ncbi:CocE/NonD family hydrolase [Cyanobacterium stanieri LEGE 03274]|uniref:CocE/NonD family hydrolase n=1 Tax=Cyanobacterium stanieri LEGE 03274 TaxID=1828756 RepID=A0ABR9V5I1_9CHRO|nr:CocE/NonD family hydrolase [Cyanobacterium stanieri]MBE9223154.1 CocE/NonD family hydrolase [Cyanobacterium stanieri LEGE 03274]